MFAVIQQAKHADTKVLHKANFSLKTKVGYVSNIVHGAFGILI